jgi:hypothetical protein
LVIPARRPPASTIFWLSGVLEVCDDRCEAEEPNRTRIEAAIAEANSGWKALLGGVSLSLGSYFQLSNQFAFAWKLAQLGTPVV